MEGLQNTFHPWWCLHSGTGGRKPHLSREHLCEKMGEIVREVVAGAAAPEKLLVGQGRRGAVTERASAPTVRAAGSGCHHRPRQA